MSRVESLRGSRDSYAVKLRDFLRIRSRRPNAYVIFFEGFDTKYYAHRIEMLRPELAWEGINSGGKDNVLKLFRLIASHDQHKLAYTLYFIDRDFDHPSELPSDVIVYITPTYSVENLYVSEQAFRRILRYEFHLSEHAEGDDSFERCLAAFTQSASAFLDCTALLNGWVMLQRRYEKAHPGATSANLNSINLNKIVQIGLQTSTATYTIAAIERSTNSTQTFTDTEAQEAILMIPPQDRMTRYRGKFQAYFFRLFLSKLCEDANLKSPTLLLTSRHVPLKVSETNFISELCQYADTPQCLREFIAAIPVPSSS
ncbi:MAG TPA: DUF4435 domain-containing protein [Gemmataceae bacterium]|jgi:hypothetical protein|nr:DUF4435 domain-containing protein [Gemmataceae bacterium]